MESIPDLRGRPLWEEVLWPLLDVLDSVRLRIASTQWNVPGVLLKKEPGVLSEFVWFGPSISAEKVKACALIGLHMMAEENALRSDSDSSVSSSGS